MLLLTLRQTCWSEEIHLQTVANSEASQNTTNVYNVTCGSQTTSQSQQSIKQLISMNKWHECSVVIWQSKSWLTARCFDEQRQSARMSKITNDGLTRSSTGCFIAVPIWQQWASKGYDNNVRSSTLIQSSVHTTSCFSTNSSSAKIDKVGNDNI